MARASREKVREVLTIGIDVGGTNMQIGVVDARNSLVGRSRKKTPADEGPQAVISTLVEGVQEACAAAGIKLAEVGAVGVAAAGAIDMPRGVILNAPNLGWLDLPLRDMLEAKLSRPVVLENDVNGAVWGEHQLGAARGQGDVIGVWVGTGVGGGLVLNGRIYHGEFFTAGEIGHTIIDAREPWGRSKVEEVCSRTGMSRMIVSRLHAYPDSIMHELIDEKKGVAGSKILARGYAAKDALTVEVIHHAADMLGVAIANCVTLLAIDTVLIGGGVTEALGEPWVARIHASFERHVFPERSREARFFMTELRENAGLLGAALLARARVEATQEK
jgi:glucokinase